MDFPDLIVGAHDVPVMGMPCGKAYVFLGSSSRSSLSPVVTYQGVDVSGPFGSAVSGGADIDGDGFSDVVVGAYQAGSMGLERQAPCVARLVRVGHRRNHELRSLCRNARRHQWRRLRRVRGRVDQRPRRRLHVGRERQSHGALRTTTITASSAAIGFGTSITNDAPSHPRSRAVRRGGNRVVTVERQRARDDDFQRAPRPLQASAYIRSVARRNAGLHGGRCPRRRRPQRAFTSCSSARATTTLSLTVRRLTAATRPKHPNARSDTVSVWRSSTEANAAPSEK